MVDAFDSVRLKLGDLLRRDRAAAAAEHAYMAGARITEHVDHVAEVFVVAALVRADGNAVRVFLDTGPHDVGDRAVVAEMHDLGAFRLNQAAHHVDGRIVAIE